jgi:hypothetical protein
MQAIVPNSTPVSDNLLPRYWPAYKYRRVESQGCDIEKSSQGYYIEKSTYNDMTCAEFMDFLLYGDDSIDKFVEMSVPIGAYYFDDDDDDDDEQPIEQQYPVAQERTSTLTMIFTFIQKYL